MVTATAVRPSDNPDDLTGSERGQGGQHLGHQRQRVMKLNSLRLQNDHRDPKPGGVLLKRQITVAGQKHVELVLLRQRQQLPVLDSAPPMRCAETA